MSNFNPTVARGRESVLSTNKVIRNTYILLSMTLVFSAVMAAVGMTLNLSGGTSIMMSLGAIGLIWLVLPRFENSSAGIAVVFGIAGLLGMGLGPLLNYYMALENGPQLVGTALGGTGVIFLGLSGYALTTRKDFSFMGGFLFVGILVVFGAMIANLFMQIPALALAVSAGIILLMSGLILYDTSRMIHGGETNYIRATVGLYLSIYNLFVSLLHILGVFSGDD